MTPVIHGDFSKVSATLRCQKPLCSKRPVYRHHKGDEHRFIRYLHEHKRKAWVKAMTRRYHAFREDDIVRVCGDHHEEIHELLYNSLKHFCMAKLLLKPIDQWTQTEVEAAVTFLRTSTEIWLTQTSVGVKTRILTTYP